MKLIERLMFRYPHGYYRGGAWENEYAPAITNSAWDANNFIIEVYETRDNPDREDMEK